MKRTITTFLLAIVTLLAANAADDAKAKSILDKASAAYRQAEGISIRFTGNSSPRQGNLKLKGDCFYLAYNGVQSWFDGKTQWSYVEQNQEVTISNPTPEELQSINPYMLINSYATSFYYRYAGTDSYKGKQGNTIILTPRHEGEVKQITLALSASGQPMYIGIQLNNGEIQEFHILSYQAHRKFDSGTFRFNRQNYPEAEVIDMR